jgi:membrane fusion protein (multidrug efflux system)
MTYLSTPSTSDPSLNNASPVQLPVKHIAIVHRLATYVLPLSALVTLLACNPGQANPSDEVESDIIVGLENIVIAQHGVVTEGPTVSGSLTAEREAVLRAQTSGSVVSVNVEAGQPVRAGALLAQLDAQAIQDAYLSAKSAVTSAQTSADLARRDVERQQTLLKAGAVAQRDLEAAQQAYTTAQAALENARAQLAAAEKNLANTRITAPFNGIVSVRSVSAGDIVQPGTALFTVVDPASLRLEGSVLAEQLSSLQVGMPVTFTVNGYPGQQFTGKITRINPAADPTTRQVRIIASIPNANQRLVTGLFAEGRVSAQTHEGIVVPINAVDLRQQTPGVVRLKSGKAERVLVTLGTQDAQAETVEITEGVQAGDTLLVGPAQAITAGTPVKVQAPPADQATR